MRTQKQQHGPKGDPPLGDKDGILKPQKHARSESAVSERFDREAEKLVGMMQADKLIQPNWSNEPDYDSQKH